MVQQKKRFFQTIQISVPVSPHLLYGFVSANGKAAKIFTEKQKIMAFPPSFYVNIYFSDR